MSERLSAEREAYLRKAHWRDGGVMRKLLDEMFAEIDATRRERDEDRAANFRLRECIRQREREHLAACAEADEHRAALDIARRERDEASVMCTQFVGRELTAIHERDAALARLAEAERERDHLKSEHAMYAKLGENAGIMREQRNAAQDRLAEAEGLIRWARACFRSETDLAKAMDAFLCASAPAGERAVASDSAILRAIAIIKRFHLILRCPMVSVDCREVLRESDSFLVDMGAMAPSFPAPPAADRVDPGWPIPLRKNPDPPAGERAKPRERIAFDDDDERFLSPGAFAAFKAAQKSADPLAADRVERQDQEKS